MYALDAAELDSADVVVGAFFEDDVGAIPGGEDVLVEVGEIDAAPDAAGGGGGFVLGEFGEAMEEGVWVLEDGFAELEEALGRALGRPRYGAGVLRVWVPEELPATFPPAGGCPLPRSP